MTEEKKSNRSRFLLPLVLLAVLTLLVSTYAASQSHVFLKAINIKHIFLAAAPAGLVAMAQLHVLLVRGQKT